MRTRAVGGSEEERAPSESVPRASQYRLSRTGQFSKFPAELRASCRCSRKQLAPTYRSPHCSNSVSSLRYFCRADDAPGRLIHDPEQTLGGQLRALQNRPTWAQARWTGEDG